MEIIFSIIGSILSIVAVVVVLKTLRVWQGVLRDGLWLFLYGFIFLGLGFVWNVFALSYYTPLTSESVSAFGMALLAAGAFKLFTFVYPS